jgi:transcriptional regulator with XRE-family HTH domain
MAEFDDLYAELGRKIRETRERPGQKLSQEKLAKRLGVSRASIVNIEAGRQHAPLHVLWQIAEALGTDLALLIPRREDLLLPDTAVPLDQDTIEQIEAAANGNPETAKAMTVLVGKLKASIEKQHQSRTSNAKTRLRK